MNPSIDVRIDSMIRALTDFIVPELDPAGPGAEQAALVTGHLLVLRGQVDIAEPFERFELRHAADEAHALLAVVQESPAAATTAAVGALRSALGASSDADLAQVRGSTERIRSAIEDVVRAAAGADEAVRAAVRTAVVEHERRMADANRALFLGNGWESGEVDLPDLTTLVRVP